MAKITVEIEDSKAEILREKAKRYGLQPNQLVAATIEDLIGQPDPDFESAMQRVLSKNRELYERLA